MNLTCSLLFLINFNQKLKLCPKECVVNTLHLCIEPVRGLSLLVQVFAKNSIWMGLVSRVHDINGFEILLLIYPIDPPRFVV